MTVPCYLDQPGCPPGSRSSSGRTACPSASRATPTRPPSSATSRARLRPPQTGAPVALRARPVRRRGRGRRRQRRAARQREQRARLRDRLDRDGRGRPCPTRSALLDLSKFPTLPDRLQQGFLDFMYLGRALIHPTGFASNPAFQDDGGPLIDTRTALLLRQQPGRDRGRRAHRDRTRLHRSVLYVPGDELQPAARAQRRLRPVRDDPRRRPIRTALERPLLLSLIQMLWDRGEPNGYAWHMTTTRCRTRRSTRCCSCSPSATTRWRTWRRR